MSVRTRPDGPETTDDSLTRYCADHAEAFRVFLKNEAVSVLLSAALAAILLGLVTYLNYVKSGLRITLYPYAPVILLILLARVWHDVAPRLFIPVARGYLDLVCAAGVAGTTCVAAIFARHGIESLNAPIQIGLALTGAFSLYPRRQQNLLRNFLLAAFSFGLMYSLDRSYAARIVVQYPIGFLLGSAANHYLLQSRKAQFRDIADARSNERHALRQLNKMLLPHQTAGISVGEDLEQTMPVGVGKAYVMMFDVAQSSRIRHDRFQELLHQTFCDCYAVMIERYQHVPLQANGYPIKWLGDGFLCSVGFPLATPTNASAADLTDSLADSFCECFCRNMANMRYRERLCCGIGVAKGTIEGFYPGNGPRLYDVRGAAAADPIALSTRYQDLRKVILPAVAGDESALVISEPVFLSLSPERQARYQAWDMSEPTARVRDDPGARAAYYRLLPAVPAAGGVGSG